MSRMTEIMHDIADRFFASEGRLNIHEAVKQLMPQIDDDDRNFLAEQAAARNFKQIAGRARNEAEKDAEEAAQLPFPELRKAYAIDLEDRFIKHTGQLTRLEFKRIIEIREQQVIADRKHLEELKKVYVSVSPYWDAHPDYIFDRVCELYVARENTLFADAMA